MFKTLISRPILFIPTLWATVESILFSELNFQEPHGGRGISNAFRHAAWNLLIARNCAYFTSAENALQWAKLVTDLHEECFPNEDFDREMDLHNNRIGREIYWEFRQAKLTKMEMIVKIMDKTKTAKGLNNLSDFSQFPNELIYFLEE